MAQGSSQHRMVALVDEGSNPFELACLVEVFGIDRPEVGGLLYDLSLCARERAVTMRQQLFTMTGVAGLEALDDADTVLVPNRPDVERPRHPAVVEAVRAAYRRGARMIGTCSGAFTLAEAGVLAGHRVTVHWQWAERFRARYPDVEVDEHVLYVDDGQVLTSAGSAAALDLALHVVRLDHGAHVAAAVARRLVFTTHRDGGQRQFIPRPAPRPRDESLAPLLEWAEGRLAAPLTTRDLARRARVSPATLHRRFTTELGTTPLTWLTSRRVDLAADLLETSDLTVDAIAARAGVGTAANLRRVFKGALGVSPVEYRRARRPRTEAS